MSYNQKAKIFLKNANQFHLGCLLTEQANPQTTNLLDLSQNNIIEAINSIRSIDQHMIEILIQNLSSIKYLSSSINKCLENGGRVFLCGCGATGRLSLVLETLWRQKYRDSDQVDKIVSFMAGGDIALISSIEKFEDFKEYSILQLNDLNFCENDLLIGSSEGGETSFVIGATLKAARVSNLKPYFIYCNPDSILKEVAQRSKKIIDSKDIVKLNLTHGPQALSGSTRMQASSITMMAIALAMFEKKFDIRKIEMELRQFWDNYCEEVVNLEKFIQQESNIYKDNEHVLYTPSQNIAISVLTDTTERSPTFCLAPFENYNDKNLTPSLCYLYFPKSKNALEAWEKLLYRQPRTIEWEGFQNITGKKRLKGFKFDSCILKKRSMLFNKKQHHFFIEDLCNGLSFKLDDHKYLFKFNGTKHYYKHLFLKMLLNTMSTIIMGRLGRYDGNMMTWVRPSNNKLIDRAIRYCLILLKEKGINATYEEVVFLIFELQEKTDKNKLIKDKSLIRQVVDSFLS